MFPLMLEDLSLPRRHRFSPVLSSTVPAARQRTRVMSSLGISDFDDQLGSARTTLGRRTVKRVT
jgi:hypothetical protein